LLQGSCKWGANGCYATVGGSCPAGCKDAGASGIEINGVSKGPLCTEPGNSNIGVPDVPDCPAEDQAPAEQGAADTAAPMLGTPNTVYGGINGGVWGGVPHGQVENDFDWDQLKTWGHPKCKEVCANSFGTCYPLKNNGYWGPPCGQIQGNGGCFANQPTGTCALCTGAQSYCCLHPPPCPF